MLGAPKTPVGFTGMLGGSAPLVGPESCGAAREGGECIDFKFWTAHCLFLLD